MVSELREKTGAGLLDCNKNTDRGERQHGGSHHHPPQERRAASAAKKADRTTKEKDSSRATSMSAGKSA